MEAIKEMPLVAPFKKKILGNIIAEVFKRLKLRKHLKCLTV